MGKDARRRGQPPMAPAPEHTKLTEMAQAPEMETMRVLSASLHMHMRTMRSISPRLWPRHGRQSTRRRRPGEAAAASTRSWEFRISPCTPLLCLGEGDAALERGRAPEGATALGQEDPTRRPCISRIRTAVHGLACTQWRQTVRLPKVVWEGMMPGGDRRRVTCTPGSPARPQGLPEGTAT